MIYQAFNDKNGVYSVPEGLMRFCGKTGTLWEKICRRKLPINDEVISRLFDEYRFSSEPFCREYSWKAPYTPEEGIKETVEWYRS